MFSAVWRFFQMPSRLEEHLIPLEAVSINKPSHYKHANQRFLRLALRRKQAISWVQWLIMKFWCTNSGWACLCLGAWTAVVWMLNWFPYRSIRLLIKTWKMISDLRAEYWLRVGWVHCALCQFRGFCQYNHCLHIVQIVFSSILLLFQQTVTC